MASILIKNGRVWDGERFQYADVLTENETVAQIAPDITCEKAYVYDAAGQIVSAGLVDLHMHMQGLAPKTFHIQTELACIPFGVTAANDAGSYLGDHTVLDHCGVKHTLFSGTKVIDNRFDASATEALLARYGGTALGIKVYFDATNSGKPRDLTPLQQACAFARERGLKVMVHCAHSPVPMAYIIRTLAPGDILTHIYHGGENTCADDHFACLQQAREKGVVLDAGFAAHVHTDLKVFRDTVAAGFAPDTISTDITRLSAYMRGGRYGMTMCMSMARHAGMPEEEIFRAVTSAPAKVLGKETQWGCLQEGRIADIAVFDFCDEGFDLTDPCGNRMASRTGYRCKLTVADGVILFKD